MSEEKKKPAAMKSAVPLDTPAEVTKAAEKFNSAAARAYKAGSAYEEAAAKLLEKHLPGMLSAGEEYKNTRDDLVEAIERNGGIGEGKNKSFTLGNVRCGRKKLVGEIIITNPARAIQELRRDKSIRKCDLERVIKVTETISKNGIKNSHFNAKLLARMGIEIRADGEVTFAEIVSPEMKTILANLLKKFPAKS